MTFRQWVIWLGMVAVLVTVLNPFTYLRVTSDSMASTLFEGDRVLVMSGIPVDRFELVVFRNDGELNVKRVVGIPGDTVEIRDTILYVNGEPVTEMYVDHESSDGQFFGPVTVDAGEIFVMGDNRRWSVDSREYGGVSAESVIGRVIWRQT